MMPIITKDEIAGAKIVKVHSTYENIDGYDCTTIYFTTDNRLSFAMPSPGYKWKRSEIPVDAQELPDEYEEESYLVKNHWFFGRKFVPQTPRKIDLIKRMKERSIIGVFCPTMDEELGFYEPDDAFLLLDDGSRVHCTMVAPHGTGGSGLHYITDREVLANAGELVDFFSVPLEDVELHDDTKA